MAHRLIGLVGKKRVGKDTAARFLVEDHGFVRYAFADPLKASLLATDPYVPLVGSRVTVRLSEMVEREGWEAAKEYAEVRRLLQAYGVAVREHVNPSVWLDATMCRVMDEERPVVITDVRFPNEADAIEAAGGVLVRVAGPRGDGNDSHVSETALDSRDCGSVLDNSGSLEDLRRGVSDLVSSASEVY